MYIVDMYLRVRRACLVEGMGIREASRVFGLHRDTVRKMLSHPVPPGYRRKRPPHRPKLEPYTGVIDRILEDDLSAPKKQRHTAKRIFERLKKEHGFDGGYTIVKDYVRERRRVVREMFVPLEHPPGHAQCDFGQAWAFMGGKKRRVHYFVMSLPHSDGIFIKAYPAETTEAFCIPRLLRHMKRTGTCPRSPSWAECRSVRSGCAPSPERVVTRRRPTLSMPRCCLATAWCSLSRTQRNRRWILTVRICVSC